MRCTVGWRTGHVPVRVCRRTTFPVELRRDLESALECRAQNEGETSMAKPALFIGWGLAIPGREQQALQLFDETM
jgi:hypothetical protein